MNYADWRARYDAMAANNGEPAHEIDRRRFWYLLEVLPPEDWTQGDEFECFRMIEAQTGNLYTWAARLDGRYYEMIAPRDATPGEILAKVCTCQRVTGEIRFDHDQMRAYAVGYWHGRHEGVDTCPFQDATRRHLYRQGYEAGIADFEVTE